jgi:hypothetical protein
VETQAIIATATTFVTEVGKLRLSLPQPPSSLQRWGNSGYHCHSHHLRYRGEETQAIIATATTFVTEVRQLSLSLPQPPTSYRGEATQAIIATATTFVTEVRQLRLSLPQPPPSLQRRGNSGYHCHSHHLRYRGGETQAKSLPQPPSS